MKTPTLLAALVTATVLAGCGHPAAPTAAGMQKSGVSRTQSHPGWGKKTWATLTVDEAVMGHVLEQRDQIQARFKKEFGDRKDFRLWMQLSLTGSPDGWKTRHTATKEVLHGMSKPHALSFDLSGPTGEYAYYLTITANVVEYRGSDFRGIWKTYEPAYVSNFGQNFRARAN